MAERTRLTPTGLARDVADWMARYVEERPQLRASDALLRELRREVHAAIRLAQIMERERCARVAERAGQDEIARVIRRQGRPTG